MRAFVDEGRIPAFARMKKGAGMTYLVSGTEMAQRKHFAFVVSIN
jgi:hypothetical protein